MKKIGLIFKETSENQIKSNLASSDAVFIVKYSGLSGPDLNLLRMNLLSSNARLFVVKNTVARRAISNPAIKDIIKAIDGPCGFVFVKDEPVAASKALCSFFKDHEKLKLEGGFLKDKLIAKSDIENMAKLPAKDVLRTQVVCALNSPIAGFVMVLNQTLKKFVYCLEQIKNKKT
jgi:large subunit ribosomal protein L10